MYVYTALLTVHAIRCRSVCQLIIVVAGDMWPQVSCICHVLFILLIVDV